MEVECKFIKMKIDNKAVFRIYVIVKLVFSVVGFSIGILSIRGVITHDWNFLKNNIIPFLGLIPFFFIFKLFENILKPSYIEAIINEREMIIRTFNPNIRNGFRFVYMLQFKKYINELKLFKNEYNNYKLLIDKFGFRKRLILQKILKDGIYESSEINISLLGQKKYTNLILSIDRLKGKINLN